MSSSLDRWMFVYCSKQSGKKLNCCFPPFNATDKNESIFFFFFYDAIQNMFQHCISFVMQKNVLTQMDKHNDCCHIYMNEKRKMIHCMEFWMQYFLFACLARSEQNKNVDFIVFHLDSSHWSIFASMDITMKTDNF